MAKFLWLGDGVLVRGQPNKQPATVKIPQTKTEGPIVIKSKSPNGFTKNQYIGTEVTDPRAIRMLRLDPRFREVTSLVRLKQIEDDIKAGKVF